jgi:hypothetical protein
MTEDKPRESVSERGLADALWTRDEYAVRHARGAIGGKQSGLGRAVAEQRSRLPRVRRVVDVVVIVIVGHREIRAVTRWRLGARLAAQLPTGRTVSPRPAKSH